MIYGGLALFPTPAYGLFFNYSFEKTLDKNISPKKRVCSKEEGQQHPRKFPVLFDVRKIIPQFHTQMLKSAFR